MIFPYSRSEAEMILRLHPAVFSPIHQPRQINNLYLDTAGLNSFYDNVFGSAHRKKYRIRWYGELFGNITNPVLEIKIKDGFIGRKLSFPVQPFHFEKGFQTYDWKQILDPDVLPAWLNNELSDLTPTLLNSYQRSYFQSHNGSFRITVDDQIHYYEIFRGENEFIRKDHLNHEVVLEVKYNAEYDKEADTITSCFPFRLIKNSKYINGIFLFRPDIAL
jgi:SPX domain protein involved in polyphosphate accumulation